MTIRKVNLLCKLNNEGPSLMPTNDIENSYSQLLTIEELEELQSKFDYQFKDISFLYQALTHKSFSNENQQKKFPNNERMEFLGDAVLQFVISDILVESYPELSEGELSKFRAVLVSENGLASLAEKINLGKFLLMGRGEILTGGRGKKSILADAFEALIAAIFLDSKTNAASDISSQVVGNFFLEAIEKAESTFAFIDNKTDLQEFVQKEKYGTLEYRILEETGPDHDKEFLTAVFVNNEEYGRGKGKSKKISEQRAAIEALKKIKGTHGR